MALQLLSLLLAVVCTISCGTVAKGKTPDFRPSATSLNGRVNKVHTDCQAAYDDGWLQSGLYTISLHDHKQIDVFCEQTLDGGWIVFQRRVDGEVDFYRTWYEYKIGFGDIEGEFWLGNDILHRLTSISTRLKVELRDGYDIAYADYSTFYVDNEDDDYELHVSGFSDTFGAGDSLAYHNGRPFSTKDDDNDASTDNLAQKYHGAWWYGTRYYSNLNGLYTSTSYTGIRWLHWTDGNGDSRNLSFTRMMLK